MFSQLTDRGHVFPSSPGTARANVAATPSHPDGTTANNWAANHAHQTVLQQHCAFFDPDHDGIIWPMDTFHGFYALGFGLIISALAMIIIHLNFSYPTAPTWVPDPYFRLYLDRIHKDKHGSDSGTYDNEGRFVPQKFEDFFEKYGDGEGLTAWQIWEGIKGQMMVMDFFGVGGASMEWLATYLFLWPADGIIRKEDVRRIYDGSIFYEVAAARERNSGRRKKWM